MPQKTRIFVDTSGWAAGLVSTDSHHTAAAAYLRDWQRTRRCVITTNYVMAELVALLSSRIRQPRTWLLSALGAIRSSDWVQVIHVDPLLDNAAWSMLSQRSDKQWSLVDCASFVVMQRRGIREALTSDHHFEQAGFTPLLR